MTNEALARLYPDLSEEKLKEARARFGRYFEVAYEIAQHVTATADALVDNPRSPDIVGDLQ